MFKNVYSLYSAFYPSLRFTLSLHFTPGPQSAVCSPQSAFYTDRFYICTTQPSATNKGQRSSSRSP